METVGVVAVSHPPAMKSNPALRFRMVGATVVKNNGCFDYTWTLEAVTSDDYSYLKDVGIEFRLPRSATVDEIYPKIDQTSKKIKKRHLGFKLGVEAGLPYGYIDGDLDYTDVDVGSLYSSSVYKHEVSSPPKSTDIQIISYNWEFNSDRNVGYNIHDLINGSFRVYFPTENGEYPFSMEFSAKIKLAEYQHRYGKLRCIKECASMSVSDTFNVELLD